MTTSLPTSISNLSTRCWLKRLVWITYLQVFSPTPMRMFYCNTRKTCVGAHTALTPDFYIFITTIRFLQFKTKHILLPCYMYHYHVFWSHVKTVGVFILCTNPESCDEKEYQFLSRSPWAESLGYAVFQNVSSLLLTLYLIN